ncbi:MAG TPA: hypothetical protein VMR49_03130, partial [Candidatus Paceibacterota bacterium]|nr:hypothetical protein [Candidatus Paceibacterota bacterium]
ESYDGTSSDNSILVFVHLQTSLSDLNLKVADLSSLDTTNATSLGSLIKEFLADQANDIADLYAKAIHSDSVETNNLKTKELCVGNACVKEEQFLEMINKNVTTQTAPSPADASSTTATEPDATTPVTVPTIDNSAALDPTAVPPVSPDPVPSDAALTAPVQ